MLKTDAHVACISTLRYGVKKLKIILIKECFGIKIFWELTLDTDIIPVSLLIASKSFFQNCF